MLVCIYCQILKECDNLAELGQRAKRYAERASRREKRVGFSTKDVHSRSQKDCEIRSTRDVDMGKMFALFCFSPVSLQGHDDDPMRLSN